MRILVVLAVGLFGGIDYSGSSFVPSIRTDRFNAARPTLSAKAAKGRGDTLSTPEQQMAKMAPSQGPSRRPALSFFRREFVVGLGMIVACI